ncbi:hypothetical protein LIER_35576 [Lithospermum erythrorhizon]|uniref:Uncharacterized protein n=1 Tax=Lithospermum erythrorhizon TaxID=34254 RepID=A0AAV3NUF4_LITER
MSKHQSQNSLVSIHYAQGNISEDYDCVVVAKAPSIQDLANLPSFYQTDFVGSRSHPCKHQPAIERKRLPIGDLEQIITKTLDSEHQPLLEAVVSQEEIEKVFLSMKSGKAPGPDGLSIEFYKDS